VETESVWTETVRHIHWTALVFHTISSSFWFFSPIGMCEFNRIQLPDCAAVGLWNGPWSDGYTKRFSSRSAHCCWCSSSSQLPFKVRDSAHWRTTRSAISPKVCESVQECTPRDICPFLSCVWVRGWDAASSYPRGPRPRIERWQWSVHTTPLSMGLYSPTQCVAWLHYCIKVWQCRNWAGGVVTR